MVYWFMQVSFLYTCHNCSVKYIDVVVCNNSYNQQNIDTSIKIESLTVLSKIVKFLFHFCRGFQRLKVTDVYLWTGFEVSKSTMLELRMYVKCHRSFYLYYFLPCRWLCISIICQARVKRYIYMVCKQ